MTIIEFNNKKNKILREYLGLDFDLIPKDQNKEVPIDVTIVDRLTNYENASRSCMYCLVYLTEDDTCCKGCPMDEAGNTCLNHAYSDRASTWAKYLAHCTKRDLPTHTSKKSPAYTPLILLIEQFKREYQENL